MNPVVRRVVATYAYVYWCVPKAPFKVKPRSKVISREISFSEDKKEASKVKVYEAANSSTAS